MKQGRRRDAKPAAGLVVPSPLPALCNPLPAPTQACSQPSGSTVFQDPRVGAALPLPLAVQFWQFQLDSA
jgi:hypothetical protein